MDEPTNEAKTPTQPPTGRFMDIQSPSATQPEATGGNETKSSDDQTAATQVVISPDGELTEAGSPEPETQVEPSLPTAVEVNNAVTEPDEPTPEQPNSNPETTTATAEESATPVEHEPQKPTGPEEHALTSHKASSTPLVAVILAILVALTLSGLVIFTFIKSKNDTKLGSGKTTSSTNSQTTTTKPQASPEDVDQVSSGIDSSLSSINETTDFAASDLSDQSLGL